MRLSAFAAAVLLAICGVAPYRAEDKAEDGYRPMFNGKDLTGWVNVNCAPSTFFVKEGEIITTGHPTGFLRTEKQYENFIAEFDWMHVNKTEVGNSGFFVWADPLPAVGTGYTRGIEVQVLVNLEKKGYYTSQGDLFSIWGATCKPDRPHPHGWERCLPSENRTKGGGEWNHYKVIGNDGVLKLHVNGKEVSGLSKCRPRKGYLALESEGAECHFKNLKIKELPSTNPKPAETADVARGFQNMDDGWTAAQTAARHWKKRDWVTHYDGKGGWMRTAKQFGDAEFIFDFRFPKMDSKPLVFAVRDGNAQEVMLSLTTGGKLSVTAPGSAEALALKGLNPVGQWNRIHLSLKGNALQILANGTGPTALVVGGQPGRGALVLRPEGEMEFGNLFVRELKK